MEELGAEDTGGMFIQCDTCKVWQHGGCVGILNEEMSPEEYFCEQCRKELHKLATTSKGYDKPHEPPLFFLRQLRLTKISFHSQKYSRYLPVQEEPTPEASPEPTKEDSGTRKSRSSRAQREKADNAAQKRRLTMNSRAGAYDEAEELRRAIEESKKDGGVGNTEGSSRRNKRSRSSSDE